MALPAGSSGFGFSCYNNNISVNMVTVEKQYLLVPHGVAVCSPDKLRWST